MKIFKSIRPIFPNISTIPPLRPYWLRLRLLVDQEGLLFSSARIVY